MSSLEHEPAYRKSERPTLKSDMAELGTWLNKKRRTLGQAALLAAGTGAAIAVGATLGGTTGGDRVAFSEETRPVHAVSGDTVWGIASTIDGIEGVDTRDVIDQIKRENAEVLKDGLQAGETIHVPLSVERP